MNYILFVTKWESGVVSAAVFLGRFRMFEREREGEREKNGKCM
jgi:hypothetical protein